MPAHTRMCILQQEGRPGASFFGFILFDGLRIASVWAPGYYMVEKLQLVGRMMVS